MKLVVAAVVVLASSARPAAAGVGVGVIGQVSRYADQPYDNSGPFLELSVDRASTQYFVELAVMRASFAAPIDDAMTLRGAVGIRYFARRFTIPGRANFGLGLEVLAGIQDRHWEDGRYETRPELAAGFQWTCWLGRNLTARVSMREFLVSAPTGMLVNQGDRPGPDRLTSGLMFVVGVAW
jgi:hypothetical protein